MTLSEYTAYIEKRNHGKSAASEHDLQVQCVRWFRLYYPKYARLLFAIPNGGQRNRIVAAKLKAEGVVAGVPDLFLAVPKGAYHGLWIEMKNGKAGKVSNKQNDMINVLKEQGYQCEVARSFNEFEGVIRDYL